MKPLFLASLSALLLLCTACASHRGRVNAMAPSTRGDVRPGFGAADAKEPPGELRVTDAPGTTTDNHSQLASKTPDGGMSATMRATNKPPPAGTLVLEGADAPGTDPDKAAKDNAAAAIAAAASGQSDANTQDAVGNDAAGLKSGGEKKPINGSDPSIGRPPSAPSRKLT